MAEKVMEAVIDVCCGVDIHKDEAVCCLRKAGDGGVKQETRVFSTVTGGLVELKEWLLSEGCTHVAVESTGVFWKPLFNVLEDALTVVLANARHVKHVPGRKTDVKDCEWLAKLLQCGLIKGSFIPPRSIRELRDLTRYRRQLTNHLVAEKNRIQKILQDANIKLSSVATNVFGVSGMKMLEALLGGEADGEKLAALAVGKLRKRHGELVRALQGYVRPHHLFMIERGMEQMVSIEKTIERVDREIGRQLKPFRGDYERLQTIPGVAETGAASILAEIGADMSVFPSEHHLASWAGICPGNNESAGKKRPERPVPATCG
jgi:transposase